MIVTGPKVIPGTGSVKKKTQRRYQNMVTTVIFRSKFMSIPIYNYQDESNNNRSQIMFVTIAAG